MLHCILTDQTVFSGSDTSEIGMFPLATVHRGCFNMLQTTSLTTSSEEFAPVNFNSMTPSSPIKSHKLATSFVEYRPKYTSSSISRELMIYLKVTGIKQTYICFMKQKVKKNYSLLNTVNLSRHGRRALSLMRAIRQTLCV